MEKRSCKNCKHKKWRSWDGWEYCMDWEIHDLEDDYAKDCGNFDYYDWTEQEQEEREYCPSATNGDYSPSCPWNAPGMRISDFI